MSGFSNKMANLDTDFKQLKKNMQEIFDQIKDDATPEDMKSQFTDTLIVSYHLRDTVCPPLTSC